MSWSSISLFYNKKETYRLGKRIKHSYAGYLFSEEMKETYTQ